MNVEELLKRVEVVEPSRNYYFIRTDGGQNYETFRQYNFIGIGWNFISLNDLTLPHKTVKSKIANYLDYDLDTTSGKRKSTSIYNKIIRFKNLKKGDLVIIPGHGSSTLSFGIIQDEAPYLSPTTTGSCDYLKRRSVKWVEQKEMADLDPIFGKVKTSRHSIHNVNQYKDYIDFATNTLYIRDNKAYLVLNVTTREAINVVDLLKLMESIQDLTVKLNLEFNLGENPDNNTVRLNIQSPGRIAFALNIKTAAVLALVLSTYSCTEGEAQSNQPKSNDTELMLDSTTTKKLQELEENIDLLKIDKQKLKQPFIK